MGSVRHIDRRNESRNNADLALLVWGIDSEGERFAQQAHARNISTSGALLTGLQASLKSGDVIGILYAGRKARFRVVWVRYDRTGEPMQAAVHRIEPDLCPWGRCYPLSSNPQKSALIPELAQPKPQPGLSATAPTPLA